MKFPFLRQSELLLIGIVFLFGCNSKDQAIQTRLFSKAPVFGQKELRTPPYQLETCGQKPRPCLIQKGNISSDFVVYLHKNPILQYSLRKSSSDAMTGIVVESDYPFKRREESQAEAGSFREISLSKFEDRIVRIRFFVKRQSDQQSVQWIEPIILSQQAPHPSADQKKLAALRNRQKNKNVFLIVLDAAGYSHFGFSGYEKGTTPVLDSIAKEGIVWDHAVAQAASTVASTGSLLTGLNPTEHRTFLSNHVLKEHYLTLAECFQNNGYKTALFSGNPNASSMTGYGQGFETRWQPHTGQAVNAVDFVEPVNQWIDSHKKEKLFAYLHLREPHSPFEPPHDLWRKLDPQTDFHVPRFFVPVTPKAEDLKRIVAAYDANLASADRELGKIFVHLKDAGLWDDSIVIVLADHGEAFWEHGKQGHNYPLFEEILRIPFVLRMPGEPNLAGKRIDAPVASIDVFPTLVDLLQFSRRSVRWNGVSLLPAIYQNQILPDRWILSLTARKRIYSCRWRGMKYVWHKEDGINENELYDLSKDPNESHNLIEKFPILAKFLHLEIARYLHETRGSDRLKGAPEKSPTIEPEVKEELKALGYVD